MDIQVFCPRVNENCINKWDLDNPHSQSVGARKEHEVSWELLSCLHGVIRKAESTKHGALFLAGELAYKSAAVVCRSTGCVSSLAKLYNCSWGFT